MVGGGGFCWLLGEVSPPIEEIKFLLRESPLFRHSIQFWLTKCQYEGRKVTLTNSSFSSVRMYVYFETQGLWKANSYIPTGIGQNHTKLGTGTFKIHQDDSSFLPIEVSKELCQGVAPLQNIPGINPSHSNVLCSSLHRCKIKQSLTMLHANCTAAVQQKLPRYISCCVCW